MTKFVLTYIGGGMPTTAAEVQQAEAAWGAWFETMGGAVIDPGNPTGPSKTIAPDGTVTDGSDATGYSLLQADSLDAATELAKACPIFAVGGSVIVAQALDA